MSEQELTVLLKDALTDIQKIGENEEYQSLCKKLEIIDSDENKDEYNQLEKETEQLYDRLLFEIVSRFDNDQIKSLFNMLNDEFYKKNKIQKNKTMWNPMEQFLKIAIDNISDSNFIDSLVANDEIVNFLSYNSFILTKLFSKCSNQQLIVNFINNIGAIDKDIYDAVLESIITSPNLDLSFREKLIDENINIIVNMKSYIIEDIIASESISKNKKLSLIDNNIIKSSVTRYGLSKIIASLCDTKEELEQMIFDEKYYSKLDFGEIIANAKISSKEKMDLLFDERIKSKIDYYNVMRLTDRSGLDVEDIITIILDPYFKKLIIDEAGFEFSQFVEYCSSRKILLSILNDDDYFICLARNNDLQKLFYNRYDHILTGERIESKLTLEDKIKLINDSRLIDNMNSMLLHFILADEDIPENNRIQMMLSDNVFYKAIDEYHEVYNPKSKNKGPFKYDKKEYLKHLFEKNQTVFKTINFDIFKDDILDIGPDFIEKISKYPVVVYEINRLVKDSDKLKFFTNMMRLLESFPNSNEIDLEKFTTRLINAANCISVVLDFDKLIFTHPFLEKLYGINTSELTDDDWKIILEIGLRDQTDYYIGFNDKGKVDINIDLNIYPDIPNTSGFDYNQQNVHDKLLSFLHSYRKKRIEKCDEKFNEAIEYKSIEIAKNAFVNKYLNINIQEAREIYRMYGHSIDKLDHNTIIYKYLNCIKMILEIEKIDTIVETYNDNNISFTFEESLFIDQQLKQVFAKDMSDSVLKVIDENGNMLRQPSYITYTYEENGQTKTKQIPIFDAGLDFKMLIHSTAAYGELTLINDNYFDSWNKSDRKKNHGICCSFISNDNMGMAAVNDVLFGFDGWDSKAIIKSSPYDLYTVNDSFDIKEHRQMTYMTAQDIIDNTRHTHNEHVLERIELRKDKINPEYPNIQPSYVIIYSDMPENIRNKAIKCASEMNIPIVYINKQKIVENEVRKIDGLINNIKQTNNIEDKIVYFEKALVSHENNRSGLKMTNPDWVDQFFPTSKMDDIIKNIIDSIKNKYLQDNNIIEYYNLSNSLINILETEDKKFEITREAVERKNYIDISVKDYRTDLISNINPDLCKSSIPKMETIISNLKDDNIDTELYQILKGIDLDEFHKEIEELQSDGLYKQEDKNHNIGHIERVVVLSKIIGNFELCTIGGKKYEHLIELLIESAKYHDCGRVNDKVDKNHGKKSAELAKEYLKEKYSDEDISIIQVAIEFHEMEDNDFYFNKLCEKYNVIGSSKNQARKIADCLKDADALDRVRFKNNAKLDTKKLRKDTSMEYISFAKQLVGEYEKFDLDNFKRMIIKQFKEKEMLSNNLETEKGEFRL